MPTVFTHTAIGTAGGTIFKDEKRPLMFIITSTALSILPDMDVFGYYLDIPENGLLGHNVLLHSPLVAFVVSALISVLLFRRGGLFTSGTINIFLFFFLIMALHGVLDGMVANSPGVAYLAPFDLTKYTLPWTPFDYSPLGIKFFFSEWGWNAFKSELIFVWPFIAASMIVKYGISYLRSRGTDIVKVD